MQSSERRRFSISDSQAFINKTRTDLLIIANKEFIQMKKRASTLINGRTLLEAEKNIIKKLAFI
jgi:hypothetical protein